MNQHKKSPEEYAVELRQRIGGQTNPIQKLDEKAWARDSEEWLREKNEKFQKGQQFIPRKTGRSLTLEECQERTRKRRERFRLLEDPTELLKFHKGNMKITLQELPTGKYKVMFLLPTTHRDCKIPYNIPTGESKNTRFLISSHGAEAGSRMKYSEDITATEKNNQITITVMLPELFYLIGKKSLYVTFLIMSRIENSDRYTRTPILTVKIPQLKGCSSNR